MRILARIFTTSLLLGSVCFADTVTLRDGRTVVGSFLGGDARSIRVAVGDRVDTFSIGDVVNISFDGSGAISNAAPPSEPAPRVFRPDTSSTTYPSTNTSANPPYPSNNDGRPTLVRRNRDDAPVASTTSAAPAAPASPATPTSAYPPPPAAEQVIPAGAVLTVRTVDAIDSDKDYVGEKFRASLDADVLDANNGKTLVPRGADVVVKLVEDQQSGKIEGRTVLTLDLVSLNINGRDVEIDTTNVTEQSGSRGARSAKVIGGTAVLGTIIGAVAGGAKGAAIGAASGAGVGTAAEVMTKGQRVRIPSETRLSFTLQQPVRY